MSFPAQFDPTTPVSTDSPSQGPALFQQIKQALCDLFGILPATDFSGPVMTLDAVTRDGRVSVDTVVRAATPFKRLIGTEGSGRDIRLVEDAGIFAIQRNDGTEGVPVWVTVFSVDLSTGAVGAEGTFTNHTGGTLAVGDVVAMSAANDTSVVLDDVAISDNQFVVALNTPADGGVGRFARGAARVTVKVATAVTRGHYLVKSATTKALADSGVAAAAGTAPPRGAIALALTSVGGAGTVTALLLGLTAAPSDEGAVGQFTNRTGSTLAAGSVVTFDPANDASVVTGDVSASLKPFVVTLESVANAAIGRFVTSGEATALASGAIARGQYVRKAAAAGAVEDAGVAIGTSTSVPAAALGIAVSTAAAGVVRVLWFGITAQGAPGGSRVRGFTGGTNGTSFDMVADEVVVRNPVDGSIVVRVNTGALANNTATAGPAANGRDQAGAFAINTWIHLYFIWDGTTLATLSSTVAPPTGPTLPTGYTHWAYAAAVRKDGAGVLKIVRARGARMAYDTRETAISADVTVGERTDSLVAFIPPNALSVTVDVEAAGTAGTGLKELVSLRVVTTKTVARLRVFDDEKWALVIELPNVSQQMFHQQSNVAQTLTVDIFVLAYRLPTGDSG